MYTFPSYIYNAVVHTAGFIPYITEILPHFTPHPSTTPPGDTTASTVENSSSPSVHPSVFVAVVAVFVMLVGILVVVIICVFTLFKRQKEKNKELESGMYMHDCISHRRVFAWTCTALRIQILVRGHFV